MNDEAIAAVGCIVTVIAGFIGLVVGLLLAYYGIVHHWPWE